MGEVAERSKAAVLKTVELKGSQGSNPCLSAITASLPHFYFTLFFLSLFALSACDLFPDPQLRKISIRPNSSKLGDSAFSPNPVRVPLGGRIIWHNDDSLPHSVVSEAKKGFCAFRSEPINQQQSFKKSFFKRMTCDYYCGIHGRDMRGKIIVE